jgi:7-cyano-7-deazaguanine synthase
MSGTIDSQPDVRSEPAGMRLEERRGAVVLLSGGLDSATTLGVALARGFDCFALTVDYGQRHRVELDRARSVALYLGVAHRVVNVDLRAFGGSALTDDIEVPQPQDPSAIGSEIPVTYVPARNTIFLSLALAWAETLEVRDLFIGANVRDYSGYPDCRPEFLRAFERVANLGTRAGVDGSRTFQVQAPLLKMTKAEIILRAADLGIPFQLTHSCYDPDVDDRACGLCDACILRRQGFAEAGLEDPTSYAD